MATDQQIRDLRDATAAAGGNEELVAVCDIALGITPPPFGPGLETVEKCRAECEREILMSMRHVTMPMGLRRSDVFMPTGLSTQAEVDAFAEAMVDAARIGG